MPRNYYPSARGTTEGAKQIDISLLKKKGHLSGYSRVDLQWSRNGNSTGKIATEIYTQDDPRIVFFYKVKRLTETEWRNITYSMPLIKSPCRYGGFRWFFVCGLGVNEIPCGRKTRILYGTRDYFGCRKCANLSYASCNKSKNMRAGVYRVLELELSAEKLIQGIRRTHYAGFPTKKYLQYLRLVRVFEAQLVTAVESYKNPCIS